MHLLLQLSLSVRVSPGSDTSRAQYPTRQWVRTLSPLKLEKAFIFFPLYYMIVEIGFPTLTKQAA
jgi:hypothetical protein